MSTAIPPQASADGNLTLGLVHSRVLQATGVMGIASLATQNSQMVPVIQEEIQNFRAGLRTHFEREYGLLQAHVVDHFVSATSADWGDEDLLAPFAILMRPESSSPIGATAQWAQTWTPAELVHVMGEFVKEAQHGLTGFGSMIAELPDTENRHMKWALLRCVESLHVLGERILQAPNQRLLVTYAYAPIVLTAIVVGTLEFEFVHDLQRLLDQTLAPSGP